MNSQKLDLIMNKLDCTNSELARITSYDQSAVSRYRNGKRELNPRGSAFEKICLGIYKYADENNLTLTLCNEIGYDNFSDSSGILPALRSWMSSGDISQKNDTISNFRINKHNNDHFFAEKLDLLMNCCELSNVRLAKLMSIDPSYISRIRCGARIPRRNSDTIKQICSIIVKKCFELEREDALASLIGMTFSDDITFEYLYDKVYAWLNINDTSADTNVIDCLIETMKDCEINAPLKQNSINRFPVSYSSQGKEYYGVKGLRDGFTRFLTICSKVSGRIIYLYSDTALNWVKVDKRTYNGWLNLLGRVLANKNRVKIIHTVERNTASVLSALKQWLPVYINGMVEPYYTNRVKNSMFSTTLMLIDGVACLRGSSVKGCEDEASYRFITDSNKLISAQREFETLLEMSNPLARIFLRKDAAAFRFYMEQLTDEGCDIALVMSGFSVCTMPKKTIEKMFEANNISKETVSKFMLHYDKMTKGFINNIENHNCLREFVYLPKREDVEKGRVYLNLNNIFTDYKIPYSLNDFKEHIKSILEKYDKYENYRIYLLQEDIFRDFYLIIKGHNVIMIRRNDPCTALYITNTNLCNAFYSWMENLESKFSCERSEVRRRLLEYLK